MRGFFIYKNPFQYYNEITQGGVFMWENSELKQRAKHVLSRFGYWTPFGATILCGLLMTDPSNLFSAIGETSSFESYYQHQEYAEILASVFVPLLVFSFLFNLFIGYPVLVGMNRFFMENRVSGSKVERVFWVFKSGNYLNVVKIMFLMNLKIFLWSLLLFIPGIIKSYQYYMIPYILAENPQISCERAFELSRQMTKGEKWKIFVLGLSFIGWVIVGMLCCCVGQFFVQPYIEATYAELYQIMREKAHGLGFSDYSELPGFFPEQK